MSESCAMARTSVHLRAQILIIDDSVETILFLSSLLKDKADVFFATTPEAGLALAQKVLPQLILLDVEMPSMDGFEVCRQLKANAITRNSAVLFMTGHVNSEHEVNALEVGAVDFLSKPLNPAVVRARVHTHLSLQEKTELLGRLARSDGLTGIYNRRHFDERLIEELRRHQRQALSLGVALIDIDFFKAYNDGYGHLMGDSCLREVAQVITEYTRRPGEVVCRYGGEEFAVILPNISQESAKGYGDWICNHVRDLHLAHAFSSIDTRVTVSVGVTACVPGNQTTADELIGRADEAMYRAKAGGRNRSEFSETPDKS